MVTHRLICEMDLIDDMMRSLSRLYDRLEDRCDCASTALEMKLERVLDDPIAAVSFERLDNERIIALPPKEWRDLIDEARALGIA